MGRFSILSLALLACIGSTLGQSWGKGSSGSGGSGSCNCIQQYIPYCATDGRREITFSNKCALECAQRSNPSLRIKFEGVCAKPYVPDNGGKGSSGKIIGGGTNNEYLTDESRYRPSYQPRPLPTQRPSTSYTVHRYTTTSRPLYGGNIYTTTNRPTYGQYQTTTYRPSYGGSGSGQYQKYQYPSSTTTRRPSSTNRPLYGGGNDKYQYPTTTSRPWWENNNSGSGSSNSYGGGGYGSRKYRETEDDNDIEEEYEGDEGEDDDDNDTQDDESDYSYSNEK